MSRPKIFSLAVSYAIGLIFIFFHEASAQSNSPYTPKIIPPSPNAASLGKFGDIPVSPYTGTTDVSVPIYTIQAKGISIPVSLSYHSGGIRLSEEAGWVGLGWALNAGGMISRIINDKDDLLGGYYNSDLTVPVPEVKGKLLARTPYAMEPYIGPWGYFFTCRYKVYTDVNTYDLYNSWYNVQTAPDSYDMEADSYSFNFLGRSGKFIIGRDKKIIMQKQENLLIQPATDGSSFTITDEQGNKYYFLDKEYNQAATGGTQHISSWLLSKIVTQQKDSVIFNYYFDNTWTTVKGVAYESIRKGVTGSEGTTYANDPGQTYYNKTLQSIDYSNAQIQFSFDGIRSDLLNGKKLNNVKIYSKGQSGLTYLKEDRFYYSYFNTGVSSDTLEFLRLRLDSVKEVSGNNSLPAYVFTYNSPASQQSLLGKHYSSVDHWGYFNGKSNAVNGNNALGFTPPYLGIATVGGSSSTVLLDLPGANRDPDASFMSAFSLSQVSYPTGGYTIFEYEPNYYDYYNSISGASAKDFEYATTVTKTAQFTINTNGTTSGTIDFSHIFYTCPNDPGTQQPIGTNGTLAIAFQAASSDSLNKYHNVLGYGKINFTFQNNTTDISNNSLYCNGQVTNGNCSGTVYSAALNLSIGTKAVFNWSAYVDPIVKIGGGLQNIVATFTWKEALFDNSTMMMAGGLRVKSVTDYSSSGNIAKKRTYDYGYLQDRNGDGTNESYSYGKMMGYLSYARYEVIDGASSSLTNHGTSFTRFSSSVSSFNSQSSGNIVGYDQVAEYTVDPTTGVDIGKTVYTFNNSSDTTYSYAGYRFPGASNLPNNLNGMPKSKVVYAKTADGYTPVSSLDYFYRAANRVIYDGMKYQHFSSMAPNSVTPIPCYKDINGNPIPSQVACSCPAQIDSTGYYLLSIYYPALSSEVVLLDSTIEKTHDQNSTTLLLTNVKRNYYDNPKHYQLTRTSSIDSKNNIRTSLIKYPQDYIPNGSSATGNMILDSMINKNMVSATIEKRDSLYYSGSSSGYVKGARLSAYKLLSTQSIGLDKQYELNIVNPVTNFQGFAINNNTTSQDSRYRQMVSYDSYDNTNNLNQYTPNDQTPVSVIWDYKSIYPIAEAKNALQPDVAYTSFEADGTGNWTISSSARDSINSITGKYSYNLSSGNISKSSLTNGKIYILTYWSRNGSYSISGGTVTTRTGRNVNGWIYYEHTVTATSTTFTISGSGNIDELRLFPQGTMMTTYTYAPSVGMISTADPNSEITYYEYDFFQRLKNVKDYQGNIVKNYQYNYANSCGSNCFVLSMQTFIGGNTLSYPVGVFNVNGTLLGNATSQSQYISLWNGNSADQTIGSISAGFDSLHFNFTPAAGKTPPSAVIGCRYYQFDIAYTKIDAVRSFNAVYIDFGDGIGFRCDGAPTTGLPTNTTVNFFSGSTIAYYVHTYPNSNNKTITFYHNDANEIPVFDNFTSPATSLTLVSNLRGNFPQNMQGIGSSCFQQASSNSIANIINWSSINSVLGFAPLCGDQGASPNTHMSYAQDFMANNKNLKTIQTTYNSTDIGYADTTFKISKLKSGWNTYFTNLQTLVISDAHWSRENLTSLTQLNHIAIVAAPANGGNVSGTNPAVSIPSATIDNIINQVAAGAGQYVSNGSLNIASAGTSRTSASDTSITLLKSKGWVIYVNGIQL